MAWFCCNHTTCDICADPHQHINIMYYKRTIREIFKLICLILKSDTKGNHWPSIMPFPIICMCVRMYVCTYVHTYMCTRCEGMVVLVFLEKYIWCHCLVFMICGVLVTVTFMHLVVDVV